MSYLNEWMKDETGAEKLLFKVDMEIVELREALKANHAHWNYDDAWIKANNLMPKSECKYCKLIQGK